MMSCNGKINNLKLYIRIASFPPLFLLFQTLRLGSKTQKKRFGIINYILAQLDIDEVA